MRPRVCAILKRILLVVDGFDEQYAGFEDNEQF